MSYDIYLKERVSGETIQLPIKHIMTGGTYKADFDPKTNTFSPMPNSEAWLNITYNYGHYYYEATDGDPRFAHDEISCVHADGTFGPMETQYGIRGIYGKTGAESIPLLRDMIKRIEDRYKDKNGEWISTTRDKARYYDSNGEEIKDVIHYILHEIPYTKEEYQIEVNEGPNEDYWEPTAGNAIRPLYQLITFAELRPDGVWDGD